MKIAYFDLISGASGDMILGALIDSGLSEHKLIEALSALNLDDFNLKANRVNKNNFIATKVDVLVKDLVPERHLSDIETIIIKSDIPDHIKKKSIAIFQRLAKTEAEIHGTSVEQVHLHELGGVDTIVDIVGVLLGIELLGIDKIFSSPVPLGRGFINGAHGVIPLPAPATVTLLDGVPIIGSDLMTETVTPTGAVLISSLAEGFGAIPDMKLVSVGYGAGGRDLPIPNVFRILIGEQQENTAFNTELLAMLETNIDDLIPEIYEYVMDQLFGAGALDVFLTPIQMKKNRPATQLNVLCRKRESSQLKEIIYLETSTLGIREIDIKRYSLDRETQLVETPLGNVKVKIARLPNGRTKYSPEYEDCRQLAQKHKLPLREIYDRIIRVAMENL